MWVVLGPPHNAYTPIRHICRGGGGHGSELADAVNAMRAEGPKVVAQVSLNGHVLSEPDCKTFDLDLNCFLLVLHGFSETDNETWQSSTSMAHLPTWIGAWPLSDRRLESLTVARARSVLAAKRRAQASPARGT